MSEDQGSVRDHDQTAGVSAQETPSLERVLRFLDERAAWLHHEANCGGNGPHLRARVDECLYIRKALSNGRYRDDGRPSWLVNAHAHRLITAAPDMLDGLQMCAERFREYAASHAAKGTPDAAAKAVRNIEMVAVCEGIIAKATGQ